MDAAMARVGRRVRELRNQMKMNQKAFGALVGVDQATVSRWESDLSEPEPGALINLSRLANQSVEEFLGEVEIGGVTTINISVIGAVQGGTWVEAVEWPTEQQYTVTALFRPDYKNARRFGLEVRGPSMNRIYPEGTVLDCVCLMDIKREPESNQRVIVHRTRADGLVEATCKEYVVDSDGRAWLWPRSNHPAHQQPILYQPDSDHGNGVESVEIIAIVVGRYQPE